jgi:hypothetical protein
MSRLFALVSLLAALAVTSLASQQAQDGTAEIRGRVTDKQTGRPMPRAHVNVQERSLNITRETVTDDDGRFRLTKLPPGRYDGVAHGGPLRVSHGFATLVSAGESIDLAAGGRREIDVALPRWNTVDVRVVDVYGDPLSGLRITVHTAHSDVEIPPPFYQQTDDLGRIRVFGIPAGQYTLCAEEGLGGAGRTAAAGYEGLRRTCYPAAEDELSAAIVTVGDKPAASRCAAP